MILFLLISIHFYTEYICFCFSDETEWCHLSCIVIKAKIKLFFLHYYYCIILFDNDFINSNDFNIYNIASEIVSFLLFNYSPPFRSSIFWRWTYGVARGTEHFKLDGTGGLFWFYFMLGLATGLGKWTLDLKTRV